jgi:hypothetical protein
MVSGLNMLYRLRSPVKGPYRTVTVKNMGKYAEILTGVQIHSDVGQV